MPSVLSKVINSAWAHTQCLQFCQKQCRWRPTPGSVSAAAASLQSMRHRGSHWPSQLAVVSFPATQSGRLLVHGETQRPGLRYHRSPALHYPGPPRWCLVAATRQSPGPRAVHSRTASRLGVSRLGDRTIPVNKKMAHGHARDLETKRGHVASWPGGRRWALILPGSPCVAHCPPPPLLDVTARCSSSAACPARGTAASLSPATCFSPWRPGRTTTRGTPAATQKGQGRGGGLAQGLGGWLC